MLLIDMKTTFVCQLGGWNKPSVYRRGRRESCFDFLMASSCWLYNILSYAYTISYFSPIWMHCYNLSAIYLIHNSFLHQPTYYGDWLTLCFCAKNFTYNTSLEINDLKISLSKGMQVSFLPLKQSKNGFFYHSN